MIQRLVAAYKLWHEIAPHFPKTSRYTLGAKIDALFLEIMHRAFAAVYNTECRAALVGHAILKLDLLKFLLQVAWEIRALDTKKYIALSTQLHEIGLMLGGWKRAHEKKAPQRHVGE